MSAIEIIILVIAIAFVVLVIFLIQAMRKVALVLDNVNVMTQDINTKMNYIQPLFRVISNVGEGLEQRTMSFKECKHDFEECTTEKEIASDLVECAIIGLNIWKKIKAKKM